jgi:tetratricopeptide (TPR) repeat protein
VVSCYDIALDIDQNDATVWYNKGVVLGKLGRFKEATECYDKAVGLNPSLATAWCY